MSDMEIEEEEDGIWIEDEDLQEFSQITGRIVKKILSNFQFLKAILNLNISPADEITVQKVTEYMVQKGNQEQTWNDNVDEQYWFKKDSHIFYEMIQNFTSNIQKLKNLNDLYKQDSSGGESDQDEKNINENNNKQNSQQQLDDITTNNSSNNQLKDIDQHICGNQDCLNVMNLVCLNCLKIVCNICHEKQYLNSDQNKLFQNKHILLPNQIFKQFKNLIKQQQKNELYSSYYYMKKQLIKNIANWEFQDAETQKNVCNKLREIILDIEKGIDIYEAGNQDTIKSVQNQNMVKYVKQQYDKRNIQLSTYEKIVQLCHEFQNESQVELQFLNIIFQDPTAI